MGMILMGAITVASLYTDACTCIIPHTQSLFLFPQGDSEIDQLFRIFRILKTPTEETWPGVSELPDFKASFPSWSNYCLDTTVHRLDAVGIDLLDKMLKYNPADRILAKAALNHPYFDDLDKAALPARPGEYEIVV